MTPDAFWTRVDQTGGLFACWPWKTRVDRHGYGKAQYGQLTERRDRQAHRVAWALTHGEVPSGLYVLHTCDNRLCCNPGHLWLGTHAENMKDMVAKGRHKPRRKAPASPSEPPIVRAIPPGRNGPDRAAHLAAREMPANPASLLEPGT